MLKIKPELRYGEIFELVKDAKFSAPKIQQSYIVISSKMHIRFCRVCMSMSSKGDVTNAMARGNISDQHRSLFISNSIGSVADCV